MAIRILDVGECGFDGPRMAALWQSKLGASVDRVNNGKEAIEHAGRADYDLILVNRVLARDGSSGLDVIRAIKKAQIDVPVMLVSDLDDAQDEAVELGAVRGFGKSALGDPSTLELVAQAAGQDQ